MARTRAEAEALASALNTDLLIDGKRVAPLGGRSLPTLDPSTGSDISEVGAAGVEDVAAAVAAAEVAAPAWRETTPRERGKRVRALASLVGEHAAQLAALDALDAGFTVAAMRADMDRAVELIEVMADAALEVKGETIPLTSDHVHYTVAEPYGVVGRLIPYNHPAFFAATKIAAPLIAGNTVVLKPPDQAPLSALYLSDLLAEVVPRGVVNVVAGLGTIAGDALTRHPKVRRIAFIGSVDTGLTIQRAAAETGVKFVTLELGGKNALIAFEDADPAQVAAFAVAGMNFTASQGQSCGSTSRLLLHRSISEEVTSLVARAVSELRIGDPFADVDMGPLISSAQLDKTRSFIDGAIDDGARLVVGGGRPAGLDTGGYYIEPTVFADVQPTSRIARDEVFGPVLSIMTFESESEAIAIANGVDYGLTAAVFTNDLRRGHRAASALEAGYVWLNETSRHFWGAPFGGVKSSGIGREEHIEEIRSFTQTKAVHVPLR